MPSFSELVLCFKPQSKPITHATFRHESYLQKDGPQFILPGFNRSGVQIQNALRLLSVERTEVPNEMNPWPLRQTALYHSFDVANGQTLFIVLKADTNILKRIRKETMTNPEMQSNSLLSVANSFCAALLVQLIVVEWCAENWSDYIDYFEQKVTEKSLEGKMAPISAATSPIAIETNISRRSATSSPTMTRMSTFARQSSTWSRDIGTATGQPLQLATTIPESGDAMGLSQPSSPATAIPPPRRRTSSLRQSVAELFTRVSSSHSKDSRAEDVEMGYQDSHENNLVGIDIEDNLLSFDEFQRMNRWSEELEQSLTVIEQNQGVLKQLRSHYQEIVVSHGFTSHMKGDDVSSGLARFYRRMEGIMQDLHVHHDRMRVIVRTLENDKALVSV